MRGSLAGAVSAPARAADRYFERPNIFEENVPVNL